jgi:branched-subunit amino acid aminotransferase/4-amino-4-deoxychorismate lyase
MLNSMDSDTFLESCRLASERESLRVRMPSREEIESVKQQIRAENDARDAHRGPPQLKVYRRPKVCRTTYSQGHVTRDL